MSCQASLQLPALQRPIFARYSRVLIPVIAETAGVASRLPGDAATAPADLAPAAGLHVTTASGAQPFSQQLWASVAPIFTAILEHQFLKGLADGSLPEETFR